MVFLFRMLQDQGRPVSPVVHTFQVYSMRDTSIKGSDNRCTGLERRGTPAVQAVIAGVHCTG